MADVDVVVVGGGFAGLVAAREVADGQKRVLLLEARDRLGGRTWLDRWSEWDIEKGGAWVHWSQPHVWAEMTRYGIGIVEDPEPEKCVVSGANGLISGTPSEIWPSIESALSRVFDKVNDYIPRPYEPLSRGQDFLDLDKSSLQGKLDSAGLDAEEINLVSGLLSSFAGSLNKNSSYSTLARWWSLSGGNFSSFWQAMLGFRMEGGTRSLVDAIAASPGMAVRTNSPVKAVDTTGTEACIELENGERISSQVIVMATPVNTWHSISFEPPLSPDRYAAAKSGWSARFGTKTIVHVSGVEQRVYAQLPEGSPIPLLFTYMDLGAGEQLLVGISGEPSYEPQDHRQVVEAVQNALPEAEIIDHFSHDWVGDPYALGAWPFHVPGEVSTRLNKLIEPEGPLVFATSDISKGWSGFIDGAIESGLRAGRQVNSRLSRD